MRRYAVERLADHLQIEVDLASRCEHLAHTAKGDKLGPIYAAARLMQANARVAEALANVAQVERRHRTIVEHHQPANLAGAHLNSSFDLRHRRYTEEETEQLRATLVKKINRLTELQEQEDRDSANAHTASETGNI